MYKYAQILNGKIHSIMEHEARLEELYEKYFANTIVFVDITNITPLPEVGMVYDGYVFSIYTDPEKPLEETKAIKTAEMKARRDALEKAGFSYLGRCFDSDAISVQRISVACITASAAILNSQNFSVDWTCKDNANVTLTAQQLLGLSSALAQHSNVLHERYRALREQINACTTNSETNAVTWDGDGT